jgi:small-conductance mechanosensitive channel
MGTHSEHIVYDLTYDNKKTQVDLKEILVSYLQSTDKTLENFVNLETKVINDLKQAMTEMTHHRDDLIKQINDQYDSLCLELQQKEAGIKLELSRSKQLVLDIRTSIENLITKVDSWLEPVMGIPEGRIEDTAKLITDVKKQIPSFDINIKTETVKFMIGDDQIKLGEIIEEGTLIIIIV